MVPARGLLFANCTMGSLTCGLGGNPHTPSHAGCRVHPLTPGVAFTLYRRVLRWARELTQFLSIVLVDHVQRLRYNS